MSHATGLARLTLVLGGARSGKSTTAEGLLASQNKPVYLATGQAGDAEMAERIRHHRDRRGPAWETVEEPLDLVGALQKLSGRPVLVDCLTLWLSNLMLAETPVEAEIERLAVALPGLAGPVVFVANEVGLGIVPDNALARKFRDCAGRLNQTVAAACPRVFFVAAGLSLVLKDSR